jgi:V/A-type H+-transporting ATPase subunit A
MIGTVSPAGGNFEEPVTQATLSTVKCFLGLSYDRAYRRFYPAIDTLISWSRYLDQLDEYFDKQLGPQWRDQVKATRQLLHDGDSIHQMMQVTGEEGISLEDYVRYQKSLFVDMVYLQQDGFDAVDVSMPLARQQELFELVERLVTREYHFKDKESARAYFIRLTGLVKNLNYTHRDSDEYAGLLGEITELHKDIT